MFFFLACSLPVWIEPRRVGGDERRLRLVRDAKQSDIVGQKREHHRRAEGRRDAVLHLRDGGALQERDEDGRPRSFVGLAAALPATGLPARRTRRSAVAAVSALVSFAAGSDGSGGRGLRACQGCCRSRDRDLDDDGDGGGGGGALSSVEKDGEREIDAILLVLDSFDCFLHLF